MMEDELTKRLEMVSAAMRQTLEESRALRLEAQKRIVCQREKISNLQDQRQGIHDSLGNAYTNIQLAHKVLAGDPRGIKSR